MQSVVVGDHRDIVGGHDHVELEEIRARRKGKFKSRQGVLGQDAARTSVADDPDQAIPSAKCLGRRVTCHTSSLCPVAGSKRWIFAGSIEKRFVTALSLIG